MRILLDTNIIIHREASLVDRQDIGILFNWLDKLHYEKCIHPSSITEIGRYGDKSVVETMRIKIQNYHVIKTLSPDCPIIIEMKKNFDKDENDEIDSSLIKEIYLGRLDILITEDRRLHKKAEYLGISHKVFTIDAFLEKVTVEYPDLKDYKVLSVKKEHFGNINMKDTFFDSFREDYSFDRWFISKTDEIAYICKSDAGIILAFLYVKIEDSNENYGDIEPVLTPKKRLKIGSFKVIYNGFKLGERFIKIIFDNALNYKVEEIYVTIFNNRPEKRSLISLFEEWGFRYHGIKKSTGEEVYIRNCKPHFHPLSPKTSYPFISQNKNIFIVPIYPSYHTELLPDSILRTESPADYIENEPHRNAIRKVYISRSIERDLESGDLIIFYRTKFGGPAIYTSVVTTIGVVESVITDIKDENHFISLCRKRSVFTDEDLKKQWNLYTDNHPFIVNFLYIYSFQMPRPNLEKLLEYGIIQQPPRGFERITKESFNKLMEISHADKYIIVD